MKLEALIVAVAVFCTACGPTDPVAPPAPRPKPVAEKPIVEPPADPPSDPNYNPSRLYQLKDLGRITLKHRGHELTLLLMDDEAKRMEGMMFLNEGEVADDLGMLFVFPNAEDRGFWMKNTLIPLDIAFVSADRKVLSVERMNPLDETKVRSRGAARYALEMKAGAFKRYGIREGQTLDLPSNLTSTE